MNPVFSQLSWGGYFHAKVFGSGAGPDYLNFHHFNNDYISDSIIDVTEAHQQAFGKINQQNLKEFIDAVNKVNAKKMQICPRWRPGVNVIGL